MEGLTLNEMHRPDTCCGFGGTFAVKFPGISIAMVENKAQWI
ncbi:MAG: (Fe-S)-binding protein, partial [Calditrichota bacterium]